MKFSILKEAIDATPDRARLLYIKFFKELGEAEHKAGVDLALGFTEGGDERMRAGSLRSQAVAELCFKIVKQLEV